MDRLDEIKEVYETGDWPVYRASLKWAIEEVERLREALADIVNVLGPKSCTCPDCFQAAGLRYELEEVPRIAREALGL